MRVLLVRRISKTAKNGHFMTNSDKKDNSDIKELCEYLGIGMTKARELVRGRNAFGSLIVAFLAFLDKRNKKK